MSSNSEVNYGNIFRNSLSKACFNEVNIFLISFALSLPYNYYQ